MWLHFSRTKIRSECAHDDALRRTRRRKRDHFATTHKESVALFVRVFDSIVFCALFERERERENRKEMRENATLDEDEEEAATSPRGGGFNRREERNEKMKRRRGRRERLRRRKKR